MRYRYEAKNLGGGAFRGIMEAADKDALLKGPQFKGLYRMDHHSMESGAKLHLIKLRGRMSPPPCRQLTAMLAAGAPLPRTLAVGYESSQSRAVKETLIELRGGVRRERTLYEATGEVSGAFPKLLIYIVQAGKVNGTLDRMLERMTEYYDRGEKPNGRVRMAMTYPVILFCITVIAPVSMLATVLPQFASMMKEQELPQTTCLMMGVSISLGNHGLCHMILIMVFIALSIGVLTIPFIRLRADRATLHIPVIDKLLRTVETSRLAFTFTVLYGDGAGVLDAIRASEHITGNAYMEKCPERAAENMKRGETFLQVLEEPDVFYPILMPMVMVGRESRALNTVLSRTGGRYQRKADGTLGQVAALLEPVMILFMALIVDSIVMTVMIPIFNIYSSML